MGCEWFEKMLCMCFVLIVVMMVLKCMLFLMLGLSRNILFFLMMWVLVLGLVKGFGFFCVMCCIFFLRLM